MTEVLGSSVWWWCGEIGELPACWCLLVYTVIDLSGGVDVDTVAVVLYVVVVVAVLIL